MSEYSQKRFIATPLRLAKHCWQELPAPDSHAKQKVNHYTGAGEDLAMIGNWMNREGVSEKV
jgi:hypothetical protein